jgi:hypothetical protein
MSLQKQHVQLLPTTLVPVRGDAIAHRVTWRRGDGDVGKLAGRPVRLRFVMNDADLYALRFVEEKPLEAAYIDEPPVVIAATHALDAPGGALTVEAFLYFDPPYDYPITSRVLSKYDHTTGGLDGSGKDATSDEDGWVNLAFEGTSWEVFHLLPDNEDNRRKRDSIAARKSTLDDAMQAVEPGDKQIQ